MTLVARMVVDDVIHARVTRRTMGFIGKRPGKIASLGSGTFIRFGRVAGILTCAHVLEAVCQESEIGILRFPVRPDTFQNLTIDRALVAEIAIRPAEWNVSGPDLGFLRLPDDAIAEIEQLSSIADGERQRKRIVAGVPQNAICLNAIAGVVDELTELPNDSDPEMVTRFHAYIGRGNIDEVTEAHGLDLFHFRPTPGEGETLPASYRGTSGGGLWQLYFDRGSKTFIEARLIGVAFYERYSGDTRYLVGHGQRSVYGTLRAKILEKWVDKK